jgi:photosystem II stability/assembly factor-like uncharacterized protein/long-subunit fatty acid transport protein
VRKSLFLVLFICAGIAMARPALSNWTNLGIYGGKVFHIAIDPQDPAKLFASTYLGGGLFVSQNSGATWQTVSMPHLIEDEDTFENQAVYQVAIAAGNNDTVWAVHNYWAARSDDGGQTWNHIYNSAMQRYSANSGGYDDSYRLCRAVAIDPQNPAVVYVGTGGAMGGATGGAVYKTEDSGVTWTKLNQGTDFAYRVEDLAIDPGNPDIVWAVTNSNGYNAIYDGTIYRSDDGGRTFTPIPLNPVNFYLGGIVAVAPKPDDPDVAFVTGALGLALLEYDHTNGVWNATYAIDQSRMALDVAFAPADPDTVYTCWMRPNDSYWQGDGIPKIARGIYDGGQWNWETLDLDTQNASALRSLAVHPTDADQIFGGDETLGMLHTLDHGQSWTPVNQGLDAVIVYDVDGDDNDTSHMIAGTGSGLYERPAGAARWQRRHNGTFRSVRFEPLSGTTYYGGSIGYVARTPDNGATWSYSNSLGNAAVEDIAVDAVNPDTLFIAAGQQVLRSSDSGGTFLAVLNGINQAGEAYAMNTVVIDPADHTHLFAGGGNFYTPLVQGDLWESSNGGTDWNRTGLTDVIVNAVLIDPRDANVLYAGCGYSSNEQTPLYRSLDGGASWQDMSNGLPNRHYWFEDMWAGAADNVMVAASNGMVFQYNGSTVAGVNVGIDDTLYGVTGLSASAAWAAGANGAIVYFDGSTWTLMASGTSSALYDIWAVAPDDIFAVGAGGTILHYDGAAWSPMTSPTTANLNEVFATSGDHVFAVGADGTILHYDGAAWNPMTSPTSEGLYDVWGLGPDTIYVAGDNSTLLRWDGSAWLPMDTHTTGLGFRGVGGTGPDDLYVGAGSGGRVLHYNGSAWSEMVVSGAKWSYCISSLAPDTVFMADAYSGLFRYNGTQWQTLHEPGTTRRSVTDLAFHRTNPDILYAGTFKAGVFISPNQAGNWLNLGTPPSLVYAITSGSLYAATGAGLYQLTGTGVLAGYTKDADSTAPIDGALVSTDLGNQCRSIMGEYMMVVPAGVFDVFAVADNYEMASALGLTVTGSDVTWYNFDLQPGDSITPSGTATPSGGGGSGGGCFVDSVVSHPNHALFIGEILLARQLNISAGVIPANAGHAVKRSAIQTEQWMPDQVRHDASAYLIAALIMAFGVGLLLYGKARGLRMMVLLIAAAGSLWPGQVGAATLFQQVGVASAPLPVGSGARAMGMGGAFIAIADDATAASWNPAGLIQLEKPELSIVGADTDRGYDFESSAHPEIDNHGHDRDTNLNYLSATFPLAWKKNMVVSINYQRLYDFDRSFDHGFSYAQSGLDLEQQVAFDQSGHIGALGIAAALELTPRLCAGVTLNIWSDQLGWDNGWRESYQARSTGTTAGVPVSIDTRIQDRYEKFRGLNLNLGMLWESAHWGSFGAVIKTPFKATMVHHYRYEETTVYGPPVNTTSTTGPLTTDEDVKLEMPLAYGIGWSRRFSDAFTLAVDIYRTHWDDYILTDGQGNPFGPIDGRPKSQSQVEPTTHARLGVEYVLMQPHRQTAIPIRAGLFYDPEPGEDGSRDFFGLALGGGFTRPQFSFDVAYQLRWGPDVDSGNLIASSSADVIQHTVLASIIYYL